MLIHRSPMPLHPHFARTRATGAPSTVRPEDCYTGSQFSSAPHHVHRSTRKFQLHIDARHRCGRIHCHLYFAESFNSHSCFTTRPYGATAPESEEGKGDEDEGGEGEGRGGEDDGRAEEAREGKEEKARGLAVVQHAVTSHVSTHCSLLTPTGLVLSHKSPTWPKFTDFPGSTKVHLYSCPCP